MISRLKSVFPKIESSVLIESQTGVKYTWLELEKKIETFLKKLEGSFNTVFVEFSNEINCVAFYLACLENGTPLVILEPGTIERNPNLTKRFHPSLVFKSTYQERNGDAAETSWTIENCDILGDPKETVANGCAILLSTSGSTGEGKWVALSLNSISTNANSIAQSLGLTAHDRAITSLPLHYSYGLSVLNSHFYVGASIVLTSHSVIDEPFWAHLKKYEVTGLAGVPTMYDMMRRVAIHHIKSAEQLKYLTQAGGRLPENIMKYFLEAVSSVGKRFFIMYGQTEATARISCFELTRFPEKIGSVGPAIPGGEFKIENPDPETKNGEVVYYGPNVMMGYCNSLSELMALNKSQDSLRTGDIGRIDTDGFLWISGRIKRIVKPSGKRISLDEIEKELADYMVSAIGKDEKIYLFSKMDIENNGKIDFLSEKYGIHRSFFKSLVIDELPLMPSGKVDYKKLEVLIG